MRLGEAHFMDFMVLHSGVLCSFFDKMMLLMFLRLAAFTDETDASTNATRMI
jgi:hypothetical protein